MTEKLFRYVNVVIISVGFYLLFVSLFSRALVDNDIWGYLSFGRIFWENGYFPYQDIFSYTPTKPLWVYHEWLTGVIFYRILKYLGPAGLQLLRYILIILTVYLMYLTALKKGAKPTFTFICMSLALILMSYGYTPVMRAQIFTYLFFILIIYIIEIARKDKKWVVLLWILPIMTIWCNLHGGFIAGLGLIGIYALGEGFSGRKFIPLIVILVSATLLTLINPYGIDYWRYMIYAVLMPRPDIYEWFSISSILSRLNYFVIPSIIFIVLSIISFLVIIFQGKRYLTEMLIFAVVIYLGYKHIRHTILLGIVFSAFFPVIFSQLWKPILKKYPYFNQLAMFTPVLLIGFFLSTNWLMRKAHSADVFPTFSIYAPDSLFPRGALEWMEENKFEGNILPQFEWGQYLIWSCYPKCRVAIDGRYETVYPEEVRREYFDFIAGREGWRKFLNKYPHDAILIKQHIKIHLLMLKEPLWKVVYSDRSCILFIRKNYKSGEKRK